MIEIALPDDTSRLTREALLGWERSMRDAYNSAKILPRLKLLARTLAAQDGGGADFIDSIVVGRGGDQTMVFGRTKKLALMLQSPMYPAWVHYLEDAQRMIDLVETHS